MGKLLAICAIVATAGVISGGIANARSLISGSMDVLPVTGTGATGSFHVIYAELPPSSGDPLEPYYIDFAILGAPGGGEAADKVELDSHGFDADGTLTPGWIRPGGDQFAWQSVNPIFDITDKNAFVGTAAYSGPADFALTLDGQDGREWRSAPVLVSPESVSLWLEMAGFIPLLGLMRRRSKQ